MPQTTTRTAGEREGPQFILDDITLRIVQTLLDNPLIPYTKTQLADAADVSRDALYRRWDELQSYDILERAESESGGDYWRLNQDSDAVRAIATLLHQQS